MILCGFFVIKMTVFVVLKLCVYFVVAYMRPSLQYGDNI